VICAVGLWAEPTWESSRVTVGPRERAVAPLATPPPPPPPLLLLLGGRIGCTHVQTTSLCFQ
jgi:hypothetical protein